MKSTARRIEALEAKAAQQPGAAYNVTVEWNVMDFDSSKEVVCIWQVVNGKRLPDHWTDQTCLH